MTAEGHAAGLAAALATATVDSGVFELRPDYRALLIHVSGVRGGETDEASDAALREAESRAARRLAGAPPESLPEITSWRDAFAGFGVKPRQARSSIEALLRRIPGGLPRIDRLTDIYNAVSVEHLLPIGGEDADHYVGPPRLFRAAGTEPFDTVADGEAVSMTPSVGEVVWADDAGVTCRRWNWRQCVRTRLSPGTTNVLFILDALDPLGPERLESAGRDLIERLVDAAPDAAITTRLLVGTDL